MRAAFPLTTFDKAKCDSTVETFWNDHQHQRNYLFQLGKKFGYHEVHDFNKLTTYTIKKYGGRLLLCQYSNSVTKLLSSLFPEITWPNKLSRLDLSKESHREMLENYAKQSRIEKLEAWYQVDSAILKADPIIRRLLGLYGNSLITMLAMAFPEVHWEPWKFKHIPPSNVCEFIVLTVFSTPTEIILA